MLFQQSAAPTGWTKDVTLNDYGLRVVSGAVGNTPGSAFSTVFAQAATGSHVLDVTEIPSHSHATNATILPVRYRTSRRAAFKARSTAL
jgi:microcystin-dependent protein